MAESARQKLAYVYFEDDCDEDDCDEEDDDLRIIILLAMTAV
jgi:hypothetical protein